MPVSHPNRLKTGCPASAAPRWVHPFQASCGIFRRPAQYFEPQAKGRMEHPAVLVSVCAVDLEQSQPQYKCDLGDN